MESVPVVRQWIAFPPAGSHRPIHPDFVSHRARLVIEVDGEQHAENAADVERTKFIEGQGYRLLRFWNNDVLANIGGVMEVIQTALEAAVPADEEKPRPAPR